MEDAQFDQLHGQLMALKSLLLAFIATSQLPAKTIEHLVFDLDARVKHLEEIGDSSAFAQAFRRECEDVKENLGAVKYIPSPE